MVFHHGLGRSRGDSLFIAGALAGNGMVVAAIDAAKQGARSWCVADTVAGTSVGCASGVTCDTSVFAQQQGDPPTARPGLCAGNALQLVPIGCDPTVTPGCWDGTGGNSITSGSFLISANFFRSRDTVRQDILDQSMLVRVLTSANGQAVIAAAAGGAVAIDPARVFYVGQSLGSLEGTVDLAANPRISRAVLNVGGATIIDILTTSPNLSGPFLSVLASIGIVPGTPEYLLFLIATKWILDPADSGQLRAAPRDRTAAEPARRSDRSHATGPEGHPRPGGPLRPDRPELDQRAALRAHRPRAARAHGGLRDSGPPVVHDVDAAAPARPTRPVPARHGFLLDWTVPAMAAAAQQNVVSYLLGGPVSPTPVVVP